MDVLLIIMIIVVGLLLLYVNIYLLALYCHPEDAGFGTSLWCKIIVVLGMTLSWSQVLLLPVDVSNARNDAGLDMFMMWNIIYWSVLGTAVVLIPFAIFFYESDEDKPIIVRLCMTIFQEIVVIGLSCILLLVTYFYLNKSQIPVNIIVSNTARFEPSDQFIIYPDQINQTNDSETAEIFVFQPDSLEKYSRKLEISIDLVTHAMGLMCLIGYFFLIIFGGIGMSALPMDLIKSYRVRPVFRTSQEAVAKRNMLKKQSEELIKMALRLKDDEKDANLNTGWFSKRKQRGKVDAIFANLELKATQLKEEFEIFQLELDISKSNPLIYLLKLCIGIILFCITILWWVHIILYIVVKKDGFPYHPFLNQMFIDLERQNVNFIGVFFFGLFTIYLLWCVIKGNVKVGFRIPFLFTMHPMKINGTWMNSFLFNIVLILFSSVAVTHFSNSCFSEYTRFTVISDLFGIQLKHSIVLAWALENNVFELALFGWSVLAFVVLCITSAVKPSSVRTLDDKREAFDKNRKKYNQAEVELQEYFIKRK